MNIFTSDKTLIIVLLGALFIRIIFSITIPAWQSPDEYPHYWVAKELAETGSYPSSEPEFPKYEAFQPPFYYLILSIPIYFQADYMTYSESIDSPPAALVLLRLISVFAGVFSIVFSYKFFLNKFSFDKTLSIYCAAFILLLPTFIGVSSTLNNDAFVILFSILCLFYAGKNKLELKDVFLSGFFGGLAIFTKLNALPVLAIGIFLIAAGNNWRWKIIFYHLFFYSLGWLIFIGIIIYRDILFYNTIFVIAPDKIKTDNFSFSYFMWALRNLIWSFWLAFGRAYKMVPAPVMYTIFFIPIMLLALAGWFKNKIKAGEKKLFIEISFSIGLAVIASLYYTLGYKEGTMTSWGKNIYPVLPYAAMFFVIGWKKVFNNYIAPAFCLLILMFWDIWAIINFRLM